LRAARKVVGEGRIIFAFQAHHYYWTAMLVPELSASFGLSDLALILEGFLPGEQPIPGAFGQTLAVNVPLPWIN
jgi:UDP-N-acetylmuramate-alanine ligase